MIHREELVEQFSFTCQNCTHVWVLDYDVFHVEDGRGHEEHELDPDRPGTLSPIIIEDVIRTHIGFDGLLMTDDLDMKALGGALSMKVEDALKAGCDMALQCSGELKDMIEAAKAAPVLSGQALRRAEAADAAARRQPKEFDAEAGWVRLRALLAQDEEAVA